MSVRQAQDVVADHLPSFIEVRKVEKRPLAWLYKRELELFASCGQVALGHAVLACLACGIQVVIVATCKRRSMCPRCMGRRREERTHHLMTRVLRPAPYRHWILSLPAELRYNLGTHPKLITAVLACFVAAVFAYLKSKTLRTDSSLSRSMLHPVAVSVRHRASADLTPNIHFHCLIPDGVYVERTRGSAVRFLKVRPPTADEITAVAADTCRRVRRLLKRRKHWEDSADRPSPGAVRGTLTLRRRRTVTFYGRAVGTANDLARMKGADAFEVFARNRVEEGDRAGLEHLIRYLLAPPFRADQLTVEPDGSLVLRLKRPRRDGRIEERFTPHDFIEALIPLIHHPRSHAIGYHGALARNARIRKAIVPTQRPRPSGAILGDTTELKTPEDFEAWKQLHVRAHRRDFLNCPVCCDKLLLVRLVGPHVDYKNPRWIAPDTPGRPAAELASDPKQGAATRTWD